MLGVGSERAVAARELRHDAASCGRVIAAGYNAHGHREALYRFIDDADVPIDNSPTERELQNVAKLRLNMLFAGSSEGAQRACVLLGIIASCRAARVPVQAYFAWAFERLGTHRDAFNLKADQLTPAAFRKERAERAEVPTSRASRATCAAMKLERSALVARRSLALRPLVTSVRLPSPFSDRQIREWRSARTED